MRKNLESRGEIQKDTDRRGRSLDDRLKRMRLVVAETKVVCEMSNRLRAAGTREGVEEIHRAIRHASEAGVQEHAQQYAVLEKNLNECQTAADELGSRLAAARKDTTVLRTVADRTRKVGTARRHLVQGERVAKQDAEFLDGAVQRQCAMTEAAKRSRERQRQSLQNTILNAAPFLRVVVRGQSTHAGEVRGNYGPTAASGERYRQQLSKITGTREARTQRSLESEIPPEELERLQGIRPIPKEETEPEQQEEKYVTKPKPYDIGPKEYIVRAPYQQ